MKKENEKKSVNRRQTGAHYEALAAEYLKGKGYRIVCRNYRCRLGEIDLIAYDEAYLVFVEVKYRLDALAGYGSEAVDRRKQRKILQTASWYMTENKIHPDQPCRFDVVSYLGDEPTLIQDAFQL